MIDIPEEISYKMFYCEKFNCKILPSACRNRKEIGKKYKKGMTLNEKYGRLASILEIIKNCIPCKIGEES